LLSGGRPSRQFAKLGSSRVQLLERGQLTESASDLGGSIWIDDVTAREPEPSVSVGMPLRSP